MPDTWIWLGFFGGAFQAFRVAGQRLISIEAHAQQRPPSHWASPLSRVAVGVPVSAIALIIVLHRSAVDFSEWVSILNVEFSVWIGAAAALQLVATIMQTSLVKRRNFAIGIVYLKIMVPAQAVFGVFLFAESFNMPQWAALLLVSVGVFLLGRAAKVNLDDSVSSISSWDWTSLWMGLSAGVILAFTGLFIREANLALNQNVLDPVAQGMTSLLILVSLQLFACVLAISLRDPSEFYDLAKRHRLVIFTGLMSVGGSSCWFIGFALASPALVNAVGQSEFFFAMLLSLYLFHERPTRAEWIGTAVVLAGILLLLLFGTEVGSTITSE